MRIDEARSVDIVYINFSKAFDKGCMVGESNWIQNRLVWSQKLVADGANQIGGL